MAFSAVSAVDLPEQSRSGAVGLLQWNWCPGKHVVQLTHPPGWVSWRRRRRYRCCVPADCLWRHWSAESCRRWLQSPLLVVCWLLAPSHQHCESLRQRWLTMTVPGWSSATQPRYCLAEQPAASRASSLAVLKSKIRQLLLPVSTDDLDIIITEFTEWCFWVVRSHRLYERHCHNIYNAKHAH